MDTKVKVCDIVVSDEVLPHDLELRLLNDYPPYNGIFKADEKLISIACEVCKEKNIDSHIGRVVSGEAFISSSEVKNAICEKFSQLAVPYIVWAALMLVLPMLLICVIFMVFFTMGSRQATGGNARMMNFGKSRARLSLAGDSKVTLKDVAGLKEEKEDLQEIVDFLRDPGKFTKVGARIPKGVLLEGPPGTCLLYTSDAADEL